MDLKECALVVTPLAVREKSAAEMLGVSVSLVRKWRVYGGGPRFVKMGGAAVCYRVADLHSYIAGLSSREVV